MKSFLRQGISHPEFYGDVIYKLRKILGHVHFENLLYKRIKPFIKKGYDPVILQRTILLQSIATPFFFGCAVTDRV